MLPNGAAFFALKQVQRPWPPWHQLNDQLAAEADVFLRDFDRVPGRAPALALLSP
jgi:hypothetical protein